MGRDGPRYGDVLRRLAPGEVTGTHEARGVGLRVDLGDTRISIDPTRVTAWIDVAMLAGFDDSEWMVWTPGVEPFEDLD